MKKINQGNAQLISLVLVLTIAMMAAPRGIEMMAQQQSERVWDVTASQFNAVQMAARQYISDNISTLATQVKPGHPVYVTVNTLKTTGHLPAGFGANDHNQSYLIAVVSNPKMTSQLQAFVMTTGGQPWDFGALRHISGSISGLGGYVWPDNQAVGAGGGWKMKLADYGLSSKQGSLVTFIPSDQLGTSGQGNDRLYRYAVNGHPDFNRMHTAIDMDGNNLSNAGDITGKQAIISGGISGQSATINGEIKGQQATITGDIKSTGGWITTQGNKGWLNETYGGGFYMSDSSWMRSLNNKGIYTAGEIRGGQLRSDGNVSVGGVLDLDQINVANTYCPKNGSVSRTATGAPLSCQSGVWGGGAKINSNACTWVSSPDAWVNPGQRQFYKTAYCPTGYIQTGSRFMLWPKGLDDEHVDVYCCPFN
ncbi:shufflon system plasmid conjugative transfer pilus tip adhesin PilV [Salmonella enterica]|uniref:Shufflon system plasmid conjugative transfer pilus tip adhesin PilV n=2 Tax=Salmonella enterica TaxID=28901 RepID=A0A3K8Y9L2_SALER|nr:shufflon system plasmid conjugative transfer pilus tip adhesin PilV [Salmonella enterica]EDU3678783.1 shufflon system plasmid conjugative transfer pilus tip adhesin PilV [Salmonella enterica subsp. enterica serovar Baildon]EEE1766961.1 shufflon system plasmid conjugative transfer pilus tip adhesin PilV [Salmonella enterica subsp. houtenae serovar 48:z4,z32:-]EHF3124792.1 shufflon system plasmid conjugative transfer pilus tip adhesin PilV [Salmonella enterica subsp. enterica serovar Muenchen]